MVLVMEAIQPSAALASSSSPLNVADLRRQEYRGNDEEGEYYLGESSL